MKVESLIAAVCFVSIGALAENRPDFSGTWNFSPEKSKNLGMMAQMKMTASIQQSDSALDVTTHSTYQGRDQETKTHYDLSGGRTTNESPMGGPAETTVKWDGDKLVATWTSQSSVAGANVVRTETRSLSADTKVMTVESVHGTNAPIVMVRSPPDAKSPAPWDGINLSLLSP